MWCVRGDLRGCVCVWRLGWASLKAWGAMLAAWEGSVIGVEVRMG